MMTEMHLPWKVNQRSPAPDITQIADPSGVRLIADVYGEACRERALYIVRAANAHADLVKALRGAIHALRSYQYGNASPELAQSIADFCETALSEALPSAQAGAGASAAPPEPARAERGTAGVRP